MPAATEPAADVTPDTDPLQRIDPWIALADGREQLMRALGGLDQTGASLPLTLPADTQGAEWLVGDLVAHLAAWDTLIADRLRALADGATSVEVTAAPDGEWATWNAEQVAAGRNAAAGGAPRSPRRRAASVARGRQRD